MHFMFQVSDCEKDKDIMGSVVYCIHHKEGCKWSDQLRRLKVSYSCNVTVERL